MLLQTLIVAAAIYVVMLLLITSFSRAKERSSKTYFLAGANLGGLLGFFTFAATLFSTFTFLGMPDFFREHGVGAWIFLAVSDMVMVFGLIAVGFYFRKRAIRSTYYGMSGFLSDMYQSKWAGYVALLGAFLFLTPYVAIQIRGVALFFNAAFPSALPIWAWACIIVSLMLIYSEIGGLKAIIYSDVMQGILVTIIIWTVGITCLNYFGSIEAMFDAVEQQNTALLSTPGPKGVLDVQFLIGSTIAIALLPFTQPQISTRLVIMRDNKALYRMATGIGFFAILIIFPTIFMGMYGAVRYPNASTSEFISHLLIKDQVRIVAAFSMIGLVAAAISTSDSQIFALGSEVRSLLKGEDKKMLQVGRLSIFFFALIAMFFAILSSDELVLLARISFAGTSLMAPMIFTGIFYKSATSLKWLPFATLFGIFTFVAAQFKWIPVHVGSLRLDLFLLLVLSLLALIGVLWTNSKRTV